jgi:uncharacterized protein (DUF1697 family)
MPVFASVLRAVNVVGHNKIKMDELRDLYESLGLREARTFIQSGNVVFRSTERTAARVARRIEEGIAARFGFRPAVMVRTASDLRQVIAANPFPAQAAAEPNKLIVLFLASAPDSEACRAALGLKRQAERMRIEGRELYIYYPDGQGRSKLPLASVEKALKTSMTGRNWSTVNKLLEMATAMEAA